MKDTFADFTGVSVGVPLQLTLGPVSVLASVGLTASLWYPYGSLSPAPFAWFYLRSGVLLDLGEVTAGISASARTEPLPGGFTALGSPVPVQIGAELHWLVPGTRILISGMAAGEFDSPRATTSWEGAAWGFSTSAQARPKGRYGRSSSSTTRTASRTIRTSPATR